MSPEQLTGGAIDGRSDLYALGAVLYELLTARPPFSAPTSAETVLLVLENDPVAPRLLVSQVPGDLETICLKCLEKDPHQRYETAGELGDKGNGAP